MTPDPDQLWSRSANSASVSSRSAASAESTIDSGRFPPGMGITTGDWASSQASATRWALTPREAATSAKAGCLRASSLAFPSPPSGLQDREPELRAHLDLGAAAAEPRAELILHAHEALAQHGVRGPDLPGIRVGEPDHAHLPRVGDLAEGPDDVVVAHLRGPGGGDATARFGPRRAARGSRPRPGAGAPAGCPRPTRRQRCDGRRRYVVLLSTGTQCYGLLVVSNTG